MKEEEDVSDLSIFLGLGCAPTDSTFPTVPAQAFLLLLKTTWRGVEYHHTHYKGGGLFPPTNKMD